MLWGSSTDEGSKDGKTCGYTSLNHDLFVDIPTAEDCPFCRSPRSDRNCYELGAGRGLGMTERSVLSLREYDKQKDCSEKLSPKVLLARRMSLMHALHDLNLGFMSPIITTSRYAVCLTTYGPFHDRNDTTKRKQPRRRFHGLVIYR